MNRSICMSRPPRDQRAPAGVRGRWAPRIHLWPAYDGLDPVAFSLARAYDLAEAVVDEWGTVLADAVARFCRAQGVAVHTFRPRTRRWLPGRGLRWELAVSPDYFSLTAEAINVRQRAAPQEAVHLLAGPLEPAVVDHLRRQPVLDAAALLEHGPLAVALVPETPLAVLAFRRPLDEQAFLGGLADAAGALGYRVTAC